MKTKGKGFSLLEVIIAIFIITIGIAGILNLMSFSISSVAVSKSQIIAGTLAQEGLEVVRAIRDNNWLQDILWYTGLDNCSTGCRVQYNNLGILPLAGNPFLKINANGFYQYDDSGSDTIFPRKITIICIGASCDSANEIRVISEVSWNERGRSFSVPAEVRLYNWK